MGLFISDDQEYDENIRQTGFRRYKQLLSLHFGSWLKINLLTYCWFHTSGFRYYLRPAFLKRSDLAALLDSRRSNLRSLSGRFI